jgi:hypothetical protein
VGNRGGASGSVFAVNASMPTNVFKIPWVAQVFADCEHLEYGGLLEVVSFITLIAMIALAGVSVAAVTLLYAI